ncbi:dehydration-responsive element-binding protein 1D-like [Nicotiana sylvestris]|uniref:Dehydration-responsive element-binding protein 1D-like n=1 Tax=Nicotiana sylvestris TaxID=4096 RepID=A0A1U7WPC5_NICSY|nr:PREDICTED: dehydration-responsive element-binding protein 1D-like [Nicotiana sylvestris]
MDIFRSYYSDPLAEYSSISDSSSSSCNRANHSDEEVMLASNNPKKRAGRKKFRETRHPVYRGVRKRNSDKWVCELREPNKKSRIWLGTFPSAEMAARAHDVAAIALRGHSACLNFADSAWKLPIPASTDAKDIQKAAAEAAEAFRSSEAENMPEYSGEDTKEVNSTPENMFYMDEEALFFMPGLLVNMAEGLMLPPPQCSQIGDHMEADVDMPLWSYSI